MIIKTFDNVISKDLLKYVQFELQYLNYFKHESIEGDGNIFFNSITDDIPSHKFLFKIFNKKSINVKEGDLLIFPSYYLHTSKNNYNDQKKIIAFNFNLRNIR